jgi:hypothetical protein
MLDCYPLKSVKREPVTQTRTFVSLTLLGLSRRPGHGQQRQLPLLQGLLPFNKSNLPGDIMGGVILAALGIPEVMGYTKIIGTPVVTGLYTMLLPMIAFAPPDTSC